MATKLETQKQTKLSNTNISSPGQPPLPNDIYDCAICYDNIQPTNYTLTACKHYFCKPCLDAWLNINSTCPMCRSSIRKTESRPVEAPRPDVRLIPESRRPIVERNIMERYMWETYFMASNDLKNQEFQPYFADINKSDYAPANFNANQMTLFD